MKTKKAKPRKQAEIQTCKLRPCEPDQEWKDRFCGGKTLGDLIQEHIDRLAAIEVQATTESEQ